MHFQDFLSCTLACFFRSCSLKKPLSHPDFMQKYNFTILWLIECLSLSFLNGKPLLQSLQKYFNSLCMYMCLASVLGVLELRLHFLHVTGGGCLCNGCLIVTDLGKRSYMMGTYNFTSTFFRF